MTVKTNIALGLKKARKAAGMSVDEIGAALGKSGKTISAWEVGRGQPDGDELIVLCRLLGVHLSDFYGNEFEEFVADVESEAVFTSEERELLMYFRSVGAEGKQTILSVAHAMAANEKNIEN